MMKRLIGQKWHVHISHLTNEVVITYQTDGHTLDQLQKQVTLIQTGVYHSIYTEYLKLDEAMNLQFLES